MHVKPSANPPLIYRDGKGGGREECADTATRTGSLACAMPALRYMLHNCLFQPLAMRLLHKRAPTELASMPDKVNRRIDKFCESLWKLAVYSSLLGLGVYALHDQPYLWDSSYFWRGWPRHAPPGKVKAYYAAEGAFYAASVFMLVLWEERRRDFVPMLLHHIATVVLIVMSYAHSYTRVGSVVMLLHDPSDVFLEGAKLADYAGLDAAAAALFAGLAVSWAVLRLGFLPFWVIRSCLYGVFDVLDDRPAHSAVLTALLCVLVVLHVYWFSLIAGIAWSKVATGSAKDTREDDD